MRIRTVKPEFWTSETLARLSRESRLTFAGLFCYVDDYGHGADNAALVRAALYPLDDLTVAAVEGWLTELWEAGLVCRYEVDGRKFLHVRHFAEHQRVDHPGKPKAPACICPEPPIPEVLARHSGGSPETLAPEVGSRKGSRKGRESIVELASDDRDDPVLRVFDFWVTFALDGARRTLTPKRRKHIVLALKGFPEDEVCDAIKGGQADEFYSGRKTGTAWNDLKYTLKDPETIERLRDLARNPPGPKVLTSGRGRPTLEETVAIIEAGHAARDARNRTIEVREIA